MNNVKCILLFILGFLSIQISAQNFSRQFGSKQFQKKDLKWIVKENGAEYELVPDQIIVKIKPEYKGKINFAKIGLENAKIEEGFDLGDYNLLIIPKQIDIIEASEILYNSGMFDYVNPDSYCVQSSVPNDTYYQSEQWNLAHIGMEKAWDITKGSNDVTVAVIDAGAEYNHEDLINNKNTSYIGWNYADNSNDPRAYDYHGTACTGIIGAEINNNKGIAGIAGGENGSGVKMMYFQCGTAYGGSRAQISTAYVTSAINDARGQENLKVISMSLNFTSDASVIQAIDRAVNINHVVFVVSAGNYVRKIDPKTNEFTYTGSSSVQFPGTDNNVITVGATFDETDYRKTFTGTGSDWLSSYLGNKIDVVAPGDEIPTTDLYYSGIGNSQNPDEYYLHFYGTSAACPHVAGLAALILSINPTLLPQQVKSIIKSTAYKAAFMTTGYGEGRIDAYKALKYTIENYGGTFNQDVTIPAGDTWNIQSGVTLKFNSGKSLIVNGVLNANGVTFTSTSGTSANSWGNIVLNGSGASGSTISYANILYGNGIQVTNVPNFEISNCNFTDNYISVYAYGSNGTIEYNNLTSNSLGHSILIDNQSTIDCNNNDITKTGSGQHHGHGIQYGGGSGGELWQNDISYCDWGIAAIWSSSPISFYSPRNNRITNCNVGITVYRQSYPTFGLSIDYGMSSVYNNTYNAKVGISYPDYESSLTAQGNWWGSYPPNLTLFSVGPEASFDYSSFLDEDPWAGLAKTGGNISTTVSARQTDIQSTGSDNPLLTGIKLRIDKKYNEAKDFFISYLAEHQDNQQAYVELYHCYSKETADDIIKYFTSLPEEASEDHKLRLSYLYKKGGNIEAAKNINNSVIKENPNTSLATRAKIENLYIKLYHENNLSEAANIFNEVLEKQELSTPYELTDVEYAIKSFARVNGKSIPEFPNLKRNMEQEEEVTQEKPEEFSITGNYPNPFNPTTVISYTIPEEGKVQIKIFDILGREVGILVNNIVKAGSHKTEWNGTNFASGIYFYSVTFKNRTLCKKMLMIK